MLVLPLSGLLSRTPARVLEMSKYNATEIHLTETLVHSLFAQHSTWIIVERNHLPPSLSLSVHFLQKRESEKDSAG